MTVWCDIHTAVQLTESGDRVFVQDTCATPTLLIKALVARGEVLHRCGAATFLPDTASVGNDKQGRNV